MRSNNGVSWNDSPRWPAGLRNRRGQLFAALSLALAVILSAAGYLLASGGSPPKSASLPRSATTLPPAPTAPAPRPAPPARRGHRILQPKPLLHPHHAQGLALLPASPGPGRDAAVAAMVADLRLVNYYPAADPWTLMWTNWQASVLNQGFAEIHALGGNAVRIVVFPYTLGWPVPSRVMAARFEDTLTIAANHGLGVQLTLFDQWHAFNEVRQSRTWLRTLLGPYSDDPEIRLAELKNEVDPADSAEVGWVRAMLPTLRSVLPRTPGTVSVSGSEGPAGFRQLMSELPGAPMDVADIHFYGPSAEAYGWMLAAKRAAGPLPLFIGEAGFPVDNATRGVTAANDAQAHWFSVVFAAARRADAGIPAPWTLNDFTRGTVPDAPDESAENHFGLYTLAGAPRPAALVVKQAFLG